MELKQTTNSEGETKTLGARISAALQPGDLVLLSGNLGAGKTTLIQGIAAGANCTGLVNSPTFVLVSEYPGGRYNITHCDLYRIAGDAATLEELGIPEYLDTSAVLVEWGERISELAEYAAARVDLNFGAAENERHITLSALTARGERIIQDVSNLTTS